MVKGVKGARRRMGGGASGRTETASNKRRSVQTYLAAEKHRDTKSKTLSYEDQVKIQEANPSDARSLLNMLLVKKPRAPRRTAADADEEEPAEAEEEASQPAGLALRGFTARKVKRANTVRRTEDQHIADVGEENAKRRRIENLGGELMARQLAVARNKCDPATMVAGNEGTEDLTEYDEEAAAAAAAPADGEEEADVSAAYQRWEEMGVCPEMLACLKEKGFTHPTPVQDKTFEKALAFDNAVLAAAQTGSGKTLAFGLPIIQRIMKKHAGRAIPLEKRVIDCLIITPTRELAMQVHKHLDPFVQAAGLASVCIVGGMSDEKQLRLLNRSKKHRPHILVATPGRLWGLLEEGDSDYLERSITRALEYLVVDEADKMVQAKHFEEMGMLLELIREKAPADVMLDGGKERTDEERTMLRDCTVHRRSDEPAPAEQSKKNFTQDSFEAFDTVEDFLRVWKAEAKNSPYSSTHVEGMDFDEMARGMGIEDASEDDEDDEEAEEVGEALPEEMAEEEGEDLQDEGIEEVEEVEEADEENEEEEEEEEENEEGEEEEGADERVYKVPVPEKLNVFITSATLTLEAKFHEGGNRISKKIKREDEEASQKRKAAVAKGGKKGKAAAEKAQEGDDSKSVDMVKEILSQFGLARNECFVTDCTRKTIMVDTLTESVVMALDDEKELTTYYFLQKHPGRTLIFVNAISTLRRLLSILTCLGVQAYALHSEMQQRQRLKNLDRLRDNPDSIVIATDVAARGLDIKDIEYVIHYQFPRNTDTYVHRCGRTARANRKGFSLSLISPEEKQLYRKTCLSLNRTRGLPTFRMDHDQLDNYKERLSLGKQLDKALHKSSKVHVHNSWLEKSAKDMGMSFDDSLRDQSMDDSRDAKLHRAKIEKLRYDLAVLMAKPVGRSKGQFLHSINRRAHADVSGKTTKSMNALVSGNRNKQ